MTPPPDQPVSEATVEQLDPCPFCGGEKVASFHHIVSGIPDSWHVECLADDCGNGTCHHETEAEAIAAWNRRTALSLRPAPETTASDDVVEALEPFAKCCEQIAEDESDEDWAKFRLLIGDYRRAAKALADLRQRGASRATWFAFEPSTGEWTGEYCSVRPHDHHRFVAMVPLANLPKPTEQATSPAPETTASDDVVEARCGDIGAPLCEACSQPIGDLTQFPGCGGPLPNLPKPTEQDAGGEA